MLERGAPKSVDWLAIAQLMVGAAVALAVVVAAPKEGDPLVFLHVADRIYSGEVAYRDFLVEYPPLALLHLVLPRLLLGDASSPGAYQTVFSLFSLALAAGTGLAVAWLAGRGWSARAPSASVVAFAGLALALAPLVVWRYDILPTFLTALALAAVALNRLPWAGAMLGFGAAAKVFPAFLLAPFALPYLAGRRFASVAWLVIGFAATFGAVIAFTYVVAGPDALWFLSYQDDRGFEIESVIGGLVLLADVVAGTGATVALGFGSWQVTSPMIQALEFPRQIGEAAMLFVLVTAASISVVRDWRVSGRVRGQTLVTYTAATLLLVILTNKVLSPQYLVWLLPFGALLTRWQSMWLLGTCVLTTVVYPLNFDALLDLDAPMIAVLNLRNLMLIALFAWLVVPRGSGDSEAGDVAETADEAGRDPNDEHATRQGTIVSRHQEHHQHGETDGDDFNERQAGESELLGQQNYNWIRLGRQAVARHQK
jgi:hypothetical protein